MINRALIGFLLIFLTAVLESCSEPEVNGLEDERGVFSVYGALNLDKNPNYIRVKDLRIPLSSDSSLNATVEFENLETGSKSFLQDTAVEFNDIETNNFILNENLTSQTPYSITVTRPDGNSVSSIATMPGITEHSVTPNENVDCFTKLQFTFENVLPQEQIRLHISMAYDNEVRTQEITRFCSFDREGNTAFLNIETRHLLGILYPAPGTNLILCRGTESEIGCTDLSSPTVNLRYLHLGPEWKRVYPLYPVDPEDIQDVANGLGFFGGYREDTTSYNVRITRLQ